MTITLKEFRKRGDMAREAFHSYIKAKEAADPVPGYGDIDPEEQLKDFLCDLMFFCVSTDIYINYNDSLRDAQYQFENECPEEEELGEEIAS